MWQQLLFKASNLRIDNRNEEYIVAVDTITRSLLKKDRDHIKNIKKGLLPETKYGLDEKLDSYDQIFEAIVDRLEESGFLTREFFIAQHYTQEIQEGE